MVYAHDSKSCDRKVVGVRVSPWALTCLIIGNNLLVQIKNYKRILLVLRWAMAISQIQTNEQFD